MNNRLLFILVLLLLDLSARAQFSNNGRITNRANRISERQLSFLVKAKGTYTGSKQGVFTHQGPSARTLVNLGSFIADTNHTDRFQGPGGQPGPQEIAGTVRPYFFNLILQNGTDQPLAITNTDGANVRGLATFANGITTTVRSLTTAGALRFDNQARYVGGLTDAQHVDGYVSKVGRTSFTFPVGSATDSRPLTISRPPTATDHYGVTWLEGDPTTTPDPSDASALHPIGQFDTQTLTAVSPVGQWDWIPLSGTGAGLTISVVIPNLTSFASSASLRLVGWNGTKWINLSTGEKPYSAGSSYASFNTDNSTLAGTMIAGITAIGIGRFPSEFQLSGTVFDDGNGLTDELVNQIGLGPNPLNGTDIDPLRSGSQPLYASLVGTGNIGPYVVFTEPVSTSGTYSFSAVTADTYSIVLNTNPQGSLIPSLPTSWTATGEHLGTGPGSDGLADGILTGITVTTAAVGNANFGIDRRPEGTSVVLAAQPNPGGGNRTPIPASAFTATDLEDGTYASNLAGRSVSLRPASGGTLYYQGSPVSTTLTIPIFDPTQVSLDPSSNDATTAGFGYTFYDNAQVSSGSDPTLNPIYISQPYTGAGISIAGNLFDDGNGLTDNTVNQTGQGPNPLNGTAVPSATGSPTPLFVSLTIEGNVLATVPVSSAGSYSFSSVQGNLAYTLVLTTNPAGSFQSSLPSSWVYTGEFLGAGAGNDFTPDGQLSVSVGSASRTNANFGIDQRPLTQPVTLASQPNPEGTAQAPVSATAFSATDREDGNYAGNLTGRTVSLSAAVGGTLYYSTTAVSTSLTVASFDPAQLSLNPTAPGSTTASFIYTVKDNAGVNSVAATITLSFSPAISVSGNVFDDGNGLSDSQINGTAVNGPSLPVYVSLVSETTVVETVPVSVTGFFKFLSVQANKVYKLILSTVAGGSQTPSLPTQWVNTGESVPDANKPLAIPGGGTMLRQQQSLALDAVVDGILSVQVNTTNVDDIRFGIEQRPQAVASVLLLQPNPRANNRAPVYASAFSGSDPEDGTYPNNLTGRVVRLSPATGGTLYYQNGPVSIDQVIASFEPTQLTLDPTSTGSTTAQFTYSVNDQAGVESTPKPVVVPFYDEDDQNDNDPETKTIKLPTFSFIIVIPPLLLPPIILPPPPIFGILIPSFPTNVSSLTIGTRVYTKDTFPSDGVVVKTDEEGKLIENVLVDPILKDQPTGVPFQALGSSGAPISALGVLGINPPAPDVSPVLYARPSTSYGSTSASVVVTVVELTSVPTQGLITVRLTKDSRLRLSFDASQTMVNGRPVQNSVWRVDESQAGYYILTTSQRIEANEVLSIGFTGQLSPGATTGILTVSATLVGNSGGEVNIINNIDAEKIDYFQR
ncbi:hypothetical protein [Spirosoma validum]|uniref:Uncharacterized protein n=1 Tax=Spirosoma validum TaxID=2771355 RepID=A0A927GDN4_9BACT|nr:hypothetical protein [Spirosoma validum]MBD2753909.1 hypothetical protein [Spirosoma validum]